MSGTPIRAYKMVAILPAAVRGVKLPWPGMGEGKELLFNKSNIFTFG